MIREASSRPRTIAIVQARMGSSRLPGKVLRKIAGKPLLWHVIHRLKQCRMLDGIVIATSDSPKDDPIGNFCAAENIPVVRGSEDNVLARFVLAAEQTGAEIIVRVSADAPFLDAGFIDHLMQALIDQDGDYVLLPPGVLCAHQGVDPFSRRALDKLTREAADDAIAREHVSGYFKAHPGFVRLVYAPPYESLEHEGGRLTIDTPDDLAYIETLYDRLKAQAGEASLADLLSLLEREPKLKTMNAHVRQKELSNRGGHVLIRCDGGGAFGYGHVKRCLSLARALRNVEGFGVSFALNGDRHAIQAIRSAGFDGVLLPAKEQVHVLAGLVQIRQPDILIVDARENLSRNELARIGMHAALIAAIDDGSERRLAATHAYYPPVRQVQALSWKGARTIVRAGWEWTLLGFDLAAAPSPNRYASKRPSLLVSMGGSDPLELTRLAARALNLITTPFDARFIIGPGFFNPELLKRDIEALNPNFTCVTGLSDLRDEFAAADLALVTFGVTAYELAALGVPALYLGLSEDHLASASSFADAGMGEVLGLGRSLRAEDISRAVWRLLADDQRRRDMAEAARSHIDGRGAERIAADLAAALEASRDVKRRVATT